MLDWIGCCVIVTGVVVWVYGDDCSYLGRGLWLIRGVWRIVLYELMGLMWVDWSGVWGLSNRLDLVWVYWVIGWMGYVIGRGVCFVGCVMFFGMGVWVLYVTVWLGVVIGFWLWVSWWVGLGLDSGSVWGYEILAWLWVVVFGLWGCGGGLWFGLNKCGWVSRWVVIVIASKLLGGLWVLGIGDYDWV